MWLTHTAENVARLLLQELNQELNTTGVELE